MQIRHHCLQCRAGEAGLVFECVFEKVVGGGGGSRRLDLSRSTCIDL